MSFDRLFDEMRGEHKKWAVATRIYGTLYVGIRVFLIIASSIVAADTRLGNSPAAFLVGWISVLAVVD